EHAGADTCAEAAAGLRFERRHEVVRDDTRLECAARGRQATHRGAALASDGGGEQNDAARIVHVVVAAAHESAPLLHDAGERIAHLHPHALAAGHDVAL